MELQEIKTRNLKPGMELRNGRVAEVRRNLASRRMGWFVKLDNGHTVYVSRDTVKVYA